ncbi:MAG: hypothetical protein PHQ86_02750 [Dehalococcoidales bacterium]|nr:hypothetical protein [Dehalococcoidales bacterium]
MAQLKGGTTIGGYTAIHSGNLDGPMPGSVVYFDDEGLHPATDSSYNCGSSSYYWANVYGDSLWGEIQTAAQPHITSLGTLTSLTIDNMVLDTNTLTSTGDFIIDGSADIILDVAGNDVILKAAGAIFGTFSNSSTHLVIKDVSTTAMTFNGAAITFAGALGGITTITGSSDITMGNGAAATPSYNFASYTTTGLYGAAGPILCFTVSGTARLLMSTSNLYPDSDTGMSLGGTGNAYSASYIHTMYNGVDHVRTPVITIGTSAHATPVTGDLWIDTT